MILHCVNPRLSAPTTITSIKSTNVTKVSPTTSSLNYGSPSPTKWSNSCSLHCHFRFKKCIPTMFALVDFEECVSVYVSCYSHCYYETLNMSNFSSEKSCTMDIKKRYMECKESAMVNALSFTCFIVYNKAVNGCKYFFAGHQIGSSAIFSNDVDISSIPRCSRRCQALYTKCMQQVHHMEEVLICRRVRRLCWSHPTCFDPN